MKRYAVVEFTERHSVDPTVLLVDVRDTYDEAWAIMNECHVEESERRDGDMRELGYSEDEIRECETESWCVADNAHVSLPDRVGPYWYIASQE